MTALRHLPCALLLAVVALRSTGAQGTHDHGAPGEKIGRVTFPSSCKAAARPQVERGVSMLHSFWFSQAVTTFEQAAATDPSCGMAQWGIAMTLLGNPFTGVEPPKASLDAGLAASRKAVALARKSNARDRAWAAAALALYERHDSVPFRARLRAHEAALRIVHEKYPRDHEAAIFHARAVIANAPPTDLSYARQKVAIAILSPLFRQYPRHPGLAHYMIHANDSPALALQGLAAAQRYADIAPDAPHALHMPSHIFTRLGKWNESIETNKRSAAAEPVPAAAVHPMDYLVYAYLQQGRDEDAGAVVSQAVQLDDRFYGSILGYNFAAMPARYALERGRWDEAAKLTVPAAASPYVQAIARFARAIGAARSGGTALARDEVAMLAALGDSIRQRNDSYWTTIVDAQRLAASAWVSLADGAADEAVRLAREAADLEETVEKHPVTPGPLLPARELLGDMLLQLGRADEALAAYEKTLLREPNRARTLFGAARAAQLAGNGAVARKRYGELLVLMGHASESREEPRLARAYLAER